MSNRKERLASLLRTLKSKSAKKEDRVEKYTRQVIYEDEFTGYYEDARVLRPPYDPDRMYELYEESGVLGACVDAYIQNIEGYGYQVVPITGNRDLNAEEQREKNILNEFLDSPNGIESFQSIRKKVRKDFLVTGNGYLEVVRDISNKPSVIFWMDATKTRLLPHDGTLVDTTVTVKRGGTDVTLKVSRQFRTFVKSTGGSLLGGRPRLRYFKEYGDPRYLDAETGEYYDHPVETNSLGKPSIPATEVLHFSSGNSGYGVPLWIGTVFNVMGSISAEYVNYDLFDSQAIPPVIITVAGGELTDDSFDDLLTFFEKTKGVKNFHKILLLEADPTTSSLSGKDSVPKIDIKDLTSFRKDDVLFKDYLADARTSIRQHGFRLPGSFLGDTDEMNYATAKITRELAEEQIFIPQRIIFDELFNMTIIRDLGITNFRLHTKGPVIKSSEDVIAIFPYLLRSGVFSLNELVEFTNQNFSVNLESYDEEWANLPISLLLYIFQSIGMSFGYSLKEGGQPPKTVGNIQPMIDTIEKLWIQYGVNQSESDGDVQD